MARRGPARGAALPSGTVTFLFTDIEGSTQLLRRLGPRYAALLQRHQDLLRTAVDGHGGVDVAEEGDGLFFAFAGARSAVAACLDGQRALQGEDWPDGVEVNVRMGLHTGEAEPVDDDYVALAVHQAARVADAARGGQVLVSQATAAAVHEALPDDTSLQDLGKHRLKDFDAPARLFQLCHPELPSAFGDLRLPVTPAEPVVGVAATAHLTVPAEAAVHEVPADGFRTPETPTGAFRVPGDIHAHIDGCRDPADLFALVTDLGRERGADGRVRFPGKFNRILRFASGPQRDDMAFAETYRYHTPGSVQHERFDSFSTIWLGTGSDLDTDAVAALTRILGSVAGQAEAVVELERVIGVLETGDVWTEAHVPRIADPESLDAAELADFRRLATSGIEIHHSIDLPKDDDPRTEPPLAVDELPTWPNLGGWFLFDKGDSWSYRSSEFVDRSGAYQYAVHVGHGRLSEYLEGRGQQYALRTLVEQVLGIWRGGAQPNGSSQPITALAEWEMSAPPRGHVWVIAANFLGDSSPDVNRAMVQNIAEGVVYTYFLRTHADVLRLGLLAEGLERSMVANGATPDKARRSVTGSVRFVLLSPELGVDVRLEQLLRADYFLCPYDDRMGGYRLDSSGLSGERLDPGDAAYLVDALSPLLDAKVRGLFSSEEPWAPEMSYQAVVCTDLEETGRDQDQDPWLQMLAAYDRIVAREVSMHGGRCRVVRPVRNGYLLVFEEPRTAASWSRRLQFEVAWHNRELARAPGRSLAIPSHNIALGYGPISRVLRAHGYDVIGGAIDDCIDLAASLRDGRIAMSGRFADQYESYVGKREFAASTHTCADPELGPLRLLEWP